MSSMMLFVYQLCTGLHLLLVIISFIFLSCKTKVKINFSEIDDFKKFYQRHLLLKLPPTIVEGKLLEKHNPIF